MKFRVADRFGLPHKEFEIKPLTAQLPEADNPGQAKFRTRNEGKRLCAR